MTLAISEDVLSEVTDGFVLSYEGFAQTEPKTPHLTAHGKRLDNYLTPPVSGQTLADARAFSQPTIIADGLNIGQGPDITSGGIVIKNKRSLDVALPEPFGQFLPAVDAAARNLLEIYGHAGFKNAALQLVAQRTTVEPDEAHRRPFKGWHDHMDTRRMPAIDLVYAFADILPTEFQIGEHEVAAREQSLVRFGAEHIHRSPTNKTGSPLRRTWGGIIVIPFGQPDIFADNNILGAKGPLREKFVQKAQGFFAAHPGLITTHSVPEPLHASL